VKIKQHLDFGQRIHLKSPNLLAPTEILQLLELLPWSMPSILTDVLGMRG
jgi:hypothetical protein